MKEKQKKIILITVVVIFLIILSNSQTQVEGRTGFFSWLNNLLGGSKPSVQPEPSQIQYEPTYDTTDYSTEVANLNVRIKSLNEQIDRDNQILELKADMPKPTAENYINLNGKYIQFNGRCIIFQPYTIRCDSTSMHPTFGCEDWLLLCEPKTKKDIKIGDVVLFNLEDEYKKFHNNADNLIHRVIEIHSDWDGTYYTTAGDNDQGIFRFRNNVLEYGDNQRVRFDDIKYQLVGIIYG